MGCVWFYSTDSGCFSYMFHGCFVGVMFDIGLMVQSLDSCLARSLSSTAVFTSLPRSPLAPNLSMPIQQMYFMGGYGNLLLVMAMSRFHCGLIELWCEGEMKCLFFFCNSSWTFHGTYLKTIFIHWIADMSQPGKDCLATYQQAHTAKCAMIMSHEYL